MNKFLIFAGASLVSLASYAQPILKGNQINLQDVEGVKILKVDQFNGKPDKMGTLKKYTVNLPEIDQLLYFGSDGRGISGVIPSNRSMMWVVDEDFKLENAPSGKKLPGGYGTAATQTGTFSVAKLKDGSYMAMLPLVGNKSMSYFEYKEGKSPMLSVTSYGVDAVNGEVPVLAYATADNIFEASNKVWQYVVDSNLEGVTAKMREQKAYPEYYKYLGWCSWEEYRDEINEELMVTAMENIYKSELPIRWVLVDEGPQWYNCERTVRMQKGMLYSFDPDPKKFPNGLSPLMKYKKEDGIKWMGIWHHQAGFFGKIDPNNIMGEELNKLFYNQKGYRTKPDYNSQYKFFEALFGYTIEDGFDFVKVDFQGPQFIGYTGSANGVQAHVNTQRALEQVCEDNDLGLINCFALDMVCALNSSHSAVTRASQDYRIDKPAAARVQTYQCYNNKLWMGQVVYGDHDMFHSNETGDDRNRLMAVAKAMSGAPIYVSDAPEDFVNEVITPLCYEDGLLIRPLAPALPLSESLFGSPINTKNLYNVIAPLSNGAASIVSYNLYESEEDVAISGSISPEDYKDASAMIQPYPGQWELPKEGLLLFDFYQKKAQIFNKDYKFTLTGLEDKLMHLCPINNGWAVIGNTEKYLSPATVSDITYTANELQFKVAEAGKYHFWMKEGKPQAKGFSFKNQGDGVWSVSVNEKQANSKICIEKK